MTPFGGALGMVEDAINHRLYFRIEAMSDVGEVDKDEDAGFGCEIKEKCNVWALRSILVFGTNGRRQVQDEVGQG